MFGVALGKKTSIDERWEIDNAVSDSFLETDRRGHRQVTLWGGGSRLWKRMKIYG